MQWQIDSLRAFSTHSLKVRIDKSVEIDLTVFRGQSPHPLALVMGGVHGDEYEGPAAILDLIPQIEPSKLSGSIVFVPVANPKAFAATTRRHPADNGDLNRSFPGDETGGPTQRLAHLLLHECIYPADCILSLHGWSKECVVLPYAEYPAGQSETSRISREAARATGLRYLYPYTWPIGVLGNSAVSRGIPIVETEVGGIGTVTKEGQELYRDVILRFLSFFAILEHPHQPAADARTISHQPVYASCAGLFQSRVSTGEVVSRGQLLGIIRSTDGSRLEELRSPCDSIVGVLRVLASVQAGDLLFHLFTEREQA